MEKKNGLLTVVLLTTGFLIGGCSSEDNEMGASAQPGSPVLFSVASGGSDTRTIYESDLQINWQEGDEIGICSTSDNVLLSVEGTQKTAKYKVDAVDVDGHKHHATIVPSETETAVYLKWGENLETQATFYGAYPAERIATYPSESSAIFSMKYYTNQECKVSSVDNGVYKTTPDMKNAYMIAKNELTPKGDHVLLSFDPIMTTPDITITAGSYEVGTGIIQPVTVTGVSIIMPKKLNSADLNYEITGVTNGAITTPRGELKDVAEGQESVFVQIDNDGKKYVDLYEGESINLMAFLPPIPNLTGAIIQVHTLGFTDFVKTINSPLQAQSKIKIRLPDITPETTKPNNWINKLNAETPLKTMSIPAYVCSGNETPGDIEDLFKKGVRAFDAEKFTSGVILELKNEFTSKCTSLVEGTDEFIIVWIHNIANVVKWPDKWIKLPNSIGLAKGQVIFLEKYSGDFYNAGEMHIPKNKLFSFTTKVTEFSLNSSDWKAMLNNEVANNKTLYEQIVTCIDQTGCTGIVTIPNADKSFDGSYGDLLLQAVIDCNFKLRRNSKNK